MDAGFLPDTISTDIYAASVNGPVFDLPTTMSKMLYLGANELRRTCWSGSPQPPPRSSIARTRHGHLLQVGGPADNSRYSRLKTGTFQLIDSQKEYCERSEAKIVSRLTICRGRRVTAPLLNSVSGSGAGPPGLPNV